MKKDDNKFHHRLKKARVTRGLTQESLSRIAGISPAPLSRYEAGLSSPSMQNLKKICKALIVSSDSLLGLSNESRESPPYNNLTLEHQEIVQGLVTILANREARTKSE